MAIVKMKRLRVVAMRSDRAMLLQKLQRLGCVEIDPIDKSKTQAELPSLQSPDSAELTKARNYHQAAELALETLNGYSKSAGGLFSPRPELSEKDLFEENTFESGLDVVTTINETKQEISSLLGERSALEGKKDNLSPWSSIEVPLETESSASITVQFGTLPQEVQLDELKGKLRAATDLAELSLAEAAKESTYVLLTCYTPALEEAMEVLKAAGWSRVNFRGQTGTAKENISKIESRLSEITREIDEKEKLLTKEGDSRGVIQQFLDNVAQVIAREEAQSCLLDTEKTFYLEGWVEASHWQRVEGILSAYAVAYEAKDPVEEEYPDVPVKLKNSKFSRSLSVVTEMYSLPAYNGVDPNPLMAPFFIFFYGMMMADMGYGLLMIIGTQMVLSKAKPKGGLRDFCELFRMLGISTFAIGAVTAGFFGNFAEAFLKVLNPESTFTWFWKAPFTALNNTIEILVASMIFGAIHVLTGMVVSFVKKVKDGKAMDAVMDEGSWWLLFAGIGLGVATDSYVLAYAGVAALVLTQGRTSPSVVGKAVGGVASLYNITGYFGDILSYARLMALMLAGSVIAQVFNDLGVITGNVITFLLIAVVGNTLNFLLNLLGCFVHTLRLQCLEFFGKFYQDGGRAFRPLEYNTKYVDMKEV